MPIQAVIFDQNQVLLAYDHQAAQQYFKPLLPISYQELGDYWNKWIQSTSFPDSVPQEEAFWRAFWESLCHDFNICGAARAKVLAFSYASILKPYPDSRPALKALQGQGVKVGVLSNFSFASLAASLTAVGLGEYIEVAVSATVIGVAKPEPAAYAYILNRLRVPAEACLFFDNKMAHVQGAREFGIEAYLVDRGQPEHDLGQGMISDLTAVPPLCESVSYREASS